MALDPQLRAQMAQTINVASVTSVSGSGQPTWGGATSMAARVEPERRMVNSPTGDEVLTTHRIFTEQAILVTDRIWMPGDATTSTLARQVLGVDAITDEDGTVNHYETVV